MQEERDGSKWKFTCQHGPNECYGNLMHVSHQTLYSIQFYTLQFTTVCSGCIKYMHQEVVGSTPNHHGCAEFWATCSQFCAYAIIL